MHKRLLLILCCLFAALHLWSARQPITTFANQYNITSLSMDEGLPNNFVDDIIKDSRGFLWIANKGGGISRYDGFDFVCLNMLSHHSPLRSNFVRTIREDSFERVWCASERGIDVIDIYTLQKVDFPVIDSLINTPVQSLFLDDKNNLWIGAEHTLYRILFKEDGEVAQLQTVCDFESGNEVGGFCQIENQLWFCAGSRVMKVAVDSEDIPAQELVAVSNFIPPRTGLLAIFNKGDDVWIGSSMGLLRYNIKEGSTRLYQHHFGDESSLSQNYVTDIAESHHQTLLVATLKGLNIYHPATDCFERLSASGHADDATVHAHNKLNSDFINCLLPDGDNIWIGTESGGVNKLSKRNFLIDNYTHSTNAPSSLSPNPVNAIYEDEEGVLWVGTVEGGLNRKASQEDGFEHYTTAAPAYLPHNSVSCLDVDSSGRLWVGIWGGGIGYVDKKNAQDRVFHPIRMPDADYFNYARIGTICYDALNEVLWIGASNEVYVYHLNSGEVITPFRGLSLGGIEGAAGSCITFDNQLWLGLTEGLCRVDLQTLYADTLRYQLWRYKLDQPQSKLKERVAYITQSADSTLWVGSNGYGLYAGKPDEKGEYHFRALTTQHGLINDAVRGICEDDEGHIWVTTIYGVSCYNPYQNSFTNYTVADGLLSNQYYWNAIHKGASGHIYLGSNEGLSILRGFVSSTTGDTTSLVIGMTRVDGDVVPFASGKLSMHESNKTLHVEFVSLGSRSSRRGVSRYRLKGYESDWVEVTGGKHIATYRNLPSGKYLFEVQYAADGQNFSAEAQPLSIKVSPHFYNTACFILSCVLLLAFLMHRVVVWQAHRAKRRKQQLHRQVKERTLALEEQKQVLYKHNEQLKEQNQKIKGVFLTADIVLKPADQNFIERVTLLVQQNYKNAEWGVSEFIEDMGVSKSLISRKMQSLAGQSAGQFIRSYRLNVAHELLLKNATAKAMSISDIAYEVGFNDPKYFTRCFTKEFGVPPTSVGE